MKLNQAPFDEIARGLKKIELRLNDEKRQKVKIGDIIEFTCLASGNQVSVEVVGLLHYRTFTDLYRDVDLSLFGSRYRTKEALINSGSVYSEFDICRFGVLGIRLRLTD